MKNSFIVCITHLTPAELCLGYTLNRVGGEDAVRSRRIGIFSSTLWFPLFIVYIFYCLTVLYFSIHFCVFLVVCVFSVACLYLFPGFFHPFFIFVTFPGPVLQLIVFVLGSFYFILDYLFLSVYYFFLHFLLV